jgi:hypothetical protein
MLVPDADRIEVKFASPVPCACREALVER